MMTGARIFVDSNVLLRILIDEFPESEACRALVKLQSDAGQEMWISRQVLRELLVQLTHPRTLAIPMSKEQVQLQIQTAFRLFHVADEDEHTSLVLLQLFNEYAVGGKQIHDANIVATMLINGIDTLLTLNTDDFKRYTDKITLLSPQ